MTTDENCQSNQTDFPSTQIPPSVPDELLLYNYLDVTDICPNGFDLDTIDILLAKILKNHFCYVNNIIDPTLKQYVYSDNDNDSKIRIVFNTNFDAANAGKLPLIVIKRIGMEFRRIAMGDHGESGEENIGQSSFVRTVFGMHRVMCIAQTDGEVEKLAKEVFYTLNGLSPILLSDLPLLDFQVTKLGEVGMLDTQGKMLAIPIDLNYTYEYAWRILRIGPKVRLVRIVSTIGISQ